MILHRRGQVPRDDFRSVVQHRQGGGPLRVVGLAEAAVSQGCQGMGQKGHLHGVLAKVFIAGVMHQAPAVDIFHAGKHGKEMVHGASLLFRFSIHP